MCAINGFNFKDKDIILKMNYVTAHRGPDGSDIFLDDNISLGHNRLSIIDLSNMASQPMTSNDGNEIIVFNGEIYNFLELKKEIKDFYEFKTKSDTEVILASYKKWGKDCVKKFNGIFAFVIWDKKDNSFFMARDQVGVKPFYYYHSDKKFIFSSEIKAILEHTCIPRILNMDAFNHYLRVQYVPEPLTGFLNILKLPPAHYGIFKNNSLEIHQYWEPEYKTKKRNKTQLCQETKEVITSAVKRQLISDRPVGVYLSGGIDSNIVLDRVSQFKKDINTFSVGFNLSKNEDKDKFNADFSIAKKSASHYGAKHHEILVNVSDVKNLLEDIVYHIDDLVSNPTTIAMKKLAELATQNVKVVLGGDGGDELFGGYERYHLSLLAGTYRRLPKIIRLTGNSLHQKLQKLNTPAGIERFSLFMFQKEPILQKVLKKEYLQNNLTKEFFNKKYFEGNREKYFEEIFMKTDRKSWLLDYSLLLSDKITMSAGLEERVPLLDKEVVEFAATVPLNKKLNLFQKKILLRSVFRKDLPDFLFSEPKRGFFSPGAKWMRYPEIYQMAREILSENYYSETKKMFYWDNIKQILEDHYLKKEYNITIIWMLLTFQIWAKKYKIKIDQ